MRLWAGEVDAVLLTAGGRLWWHRDAAPSFERTVDTSAIDVMLDYESSGLLVIDPEANDRTGAAAKAGAIDAGFSRTLYAALVPVGEERRATTKLLVTPTGSSTPHVVPLVAETLGEPLARERSPAKKAPAVLVPAERARMDVSRDGIAITSGITGVCLLVREGDTAVRLAVRVRVAYEDTLHATATPNGLLITHLMNGRSSAVAHVAESGEVLGTWSGYGTPQALWFGDRVVAYDDEMRGQVQVLDASLHPMGDLPMPFWPVACAASLDGNTIAFANRSQLLVTSRQRDGRFATESVVGMANEKPLSFSEGGVPVVVRAAPAAAPVAKPTSRYAPPRKTGPAALGFPEKPVVAPPWEGSVGEVALGLAVRSAGGAGKGLTVELSGPALASFEPTEVEIGGVRVPVSREGNVVRATLRDVVLEPAIELPIDRRRLTPAELVALDEALVATHAKVTVHGVARAASRDLLTVAFSVPGSPSAPIKWTRPFVLK